MHRAPALPWLLIPCLCLVLSGPGRGQAQSGFVFYSNSKYGYAISYPREVFLPQGEAANGDGQVFLSPDGRAELRVYAGYNVLFESLADRFAAVLATPGLQPTYQVRRTDWFVVSGLWVGKIVYEKTRLAKETFYTVRLTYPADAKAGYDPLVAPIVNSFVLF